MTLFLIKRIFILASVLFVFSACLGGPEIISMKFEKEGEVMILVPDEPSRTLKISFMGAEGAMGESYYDKFFKISEKLIEGKTKVAEGEFIVTITDEEEEVYSADAAEFDEYYSGIADMLTQEEQV